MEEHDLSVTSTNANLVVGYRLNSLDTLCTDALREYEHLVFDLKTTEVT